MFICLHFAIFLLRESEEFGKGNINACKYAILREDLYRIDY